MSNFSNITIFMPYFVNNHTNSIISINKIVNFFFLFDVWVYSHNMVIKNMLYQREFSILKL